MMKKYGKCDQAHKRKMKPSEVHWCIPAAMCTHEGILGQGRVKKERARQYVQALRTKANKAIQTAAAKARQEKEQREREKANRPGAVGGDVGGGASTVEA